ncbi:uncharacterized protein LOC117168029 isoform X2 [Belonocnema kinseyi]|uniref:uncharacterized protein LOC117168029 isoform X2 n=1 Tax=Belonocnema kinseyi TaxID=2817044 RepID=UPI00143DB5E0|nr:uncharacterized protein LOC117168029 isoform X2 [Belonocnema kinseyi]
MEESSFKNELSSLSSCLTASSRKEDLLEAQERPFLYYQDINGKLEPVNLNTDNLRESNGFYIGKNVGHGKAVPLYNANCKPVFQKVKQFNAKGQTIVDLVYLEMYDIHQRYITLLKVPRHSEIQEE